MVTNTETRVAICIGTFRRQELLRQLLEGIARLTFRKVRTPQIQIVVVDNDESGSAQQVCRQALPWPIEYLIEPRRGITYVRNQAVAAAGSADFIAFIDDDEVPSPQWLDELLWTRAQFEADAVSGPVFPSYAPTVADWVKRGGFFDGRVFATGTSRRTCATNNVLVGTHVFREVPRFDDAYALSGAEDTHFFLRISQAGYKIVWSQEAVVFETISDRRASASWILRREYQTGNGWVFCESLVDDGPRRWAVRLFKALAHIAMGAAGAAWSFLLLNKAAAVRSLQHVYLGAGMVAALFGHRFLAYRKIPSKELSSQRDVASPANI